MKKRFKDKLFQVFRIPPYSTMVGHTCLKKKHSLKGLKLLPLIRRVKDASVPKEFARFSQSNAVGDMDLEGLRKAFMDLTDEVLDDVVEMSGMSVNVEVARLVSHCAIIYANEVGQPRGQDLTSNAQDTEVAGGSQSQDKASVLDRPSQGAGSSREPENPQKKLKLGADVNNNLLKRIEELEKDKLASVQELKDKVRNLCTQTNPSNSLILLTLDELARISRKSSHSEADTFEELARQAARHYDKIDITSLYLSVLGGKASDAISKAMRKCMKEKKLSHENPNDDKKPDTRPESPLTNLYSSSFMYPPMPFFGPPRPGFQGPSGPARGLYRSRRGGGSNMWRPRVNRCHFCDSDTHLVADCEKMKKAKKQFL